MILVSVDVKYVHGIDIMKSTFSSLLFTIFYRVKTRLFLLATKNWYHLLEDPRGQRSIILNDAVGEPAARKNTISARHIMQIEGMLTV
jgi:hypothetical protein